MKPWLQVMQVNYPLLDLQLAQPVGQFVQTKLFDKYCPEGQVGMMIVF
jgi:hypothetical protein